VSETDETEGEPEEDPNLARIEELKAKQASGQEFTDEEMEFLEGLSADPNYAVTVEEEDQLD
jgi:hypothetical protein